MVKKIIFTTILILTCIFSSTVFADYQAICVRAIAGSESSEHVTMDNYAITLKGIVRGNATLYKWDFGDGKETEWTNITDPYNLGVKHTYTGTVGKKFLATLYVKDEEGTESFDRFPIVIALPSDADISIAEHFNLKRRIAIAEGLWWLHTQQKRNVFAEGSPGYEQPYGYWIETSSTDYNVVASGVAIEAFQMDGIKAIGDYDGDPYVETVQRGLNYLLSKVYSTEIGLQTAGDPDTNGNGIGLYINYTSALDNARQTYIGGICALSFATSGSPNRIAEVGRVNVKGRTYKEIVQDFVDFFAWGQCDESTGASRGGWRYYANYSNADMSTTQWPPLAMRYAEKKNDPAMMGAVVPQFVKDELSIYLSNVQNISKDTNNGGFGYNDTTGHINVTKAAAGMICYEFIKTPLNQTFIEEKTIQMAIGFIYRHWNDSSTDWIYQKILGNSYGMYGVMKAFRIPEEDEIIDHLYITEYDYNNDTQTSNLFDWYYTPQGQENTGLGTYIINHQKIDGSWNDTAGGPNDLYGTFSTAWHILTLHPGVGILQPVANICNCGYLEYDLFQDIRLDGSCSFHVDQFRNIINYEWDFSYDGKTFTADATGMNVTINGGFQKEGYYIIALRVIDDNPNVPQSNIASCSIYIHPPPHAPHPNAGGPYEGWIGKPVTFDASKSWDPNDDPLTFEWDLDNDGIFGTDDDKLFDIENTFDKTGETVSYTWTTEYEGIVALRVTDQPQQAYTPISKIASASVIIGNHPPVSDAGGSYRIKIYRSSRLNGSNSYDSDPNDSITYAWDLNNDGNFSDSLDMNPVFTCSQEPLIHQVNLKVTDSFGKYNIDSATVECVDICVEDNTGSIDIVRKYDYESSVVNDENMFQLTVRIQEAPNTVSALGFVVEYPHELIEYNEIFCKGPLVHGFTLFHVFQNAPGKLTIGGFAPENDFSNSILKGESGDIVHLSFNRISSSIDTIDEITLSELKDDIATWSSSGSCVNSLCDCDINKDGEITPMDALGAFQKYLQICPTQCCGDCNGICCDVNLDNECTPADALEIFRGYLGITPNACSKQ